MSTATPQNITVTVARRRFEPGMIVLDPRPDEDGAMVWAVASTTARLTVLVSYQDGAQLAARLEGADCGLMPEGWTVLDNEKIASVFAGDGRHAQDSGPDDQAHEDAKSQPPPAQQAKAGE